MKEDIRFGVITVQNLPWEKEVERWKLIENLGFDSVWLADHFTNPFNHTEHWFESWTLLASLAVVTNKIRIGTLVTSMPLRNPAVLARQVLTIDHISNGRLDFGFGTGVSGVGNPGDPVYNMIGIKDWSGSERVKRFKEQIEIIDSLLRQEISNYEGQFYNLNRAAMNPKTIQKPRPPFIIAALGDSMLKIAAQYADTWNFFGNENYNWLDSDENILDNTKKCVKTIDKYCEEIGRDPKTLRRSILFLGSHGSTIFNSEDKFRKAIYEYKELGMTEFILSFPSKFDIKSVEQLTRIAKNVIPELR